MIFFFFKIGLFVFLLLKRDQGCSPCEDVSCWFLARLTRFHLKPLFSETFHPHLAWAVLLSLLPRNALPHVPPLLTRAPCAQEQHCERSICPSELNPNSLQASPVCPLGDTMFHPSA